MNRSKSLRMDGYDYSSVGTYFVTIGTNPRIDWFGEIIDGKMKLNEFGYIADRFWKLIPSLHSNTKIHEYTIMPDHVHGIVGITEHGDTKICGNNNIGFNNGPNVEVGSDDVEVGQCPTSTSKKLPKNKTLSQIIGGYKSEVTKMMWYSHHQYEFGWQRSYWDRIIRNDVEFKRITAYIINNSKNYRI